MEQPDLVHYLPLATTVVAAAFALALVRRYAAKGGGLHLAWWAAGAVCYGLGTGLEGAITLAGNTPALNRLWYAAGALLGAYPLAQGSAYLLLDRARAHWTTACTLPLVALLVAGALAAPIDAALLEAHRPSVAALGSSWVRALAPVVNVYAALVLVGGAVASALRFAREGGAAARVAGNAAIALGALLPGIGGALARYGRVEALYVTELVGLLLICLGYRLCVRAPLVASAPAPSAA